MKTKDEGALYMGTFDGFLQGLIEPIGGLLVSRVNDRRDSIPPFAQRRNILVCRPNEVSWNGEAWYERDNGPLMVRH